MSKKDDALKLALEYRPTMDEEVLHSWATEMKKAVQEALAYQAEHMSKEAMRLAKAWFERNTYGDEAVDVYEALCEALAEQPSGGATSAQLPFGVGGGLVAIKTLLSRDPCVHANTAIQMIDAILAEQPAQQKPVIDHSCKDAYELIMKWADIYAAQTGCIYSEAAQDPSKVARMADERTILAGVVAQAFSQPSPPPECQTEAEKTAYAFGWFKALESVRNQPSQDDPDLQDKDPDLVEQPAQQEPENGLRLQDIRVEMYPPQPTSGMVVGMSKGVRLIHTPTGTIVECDTERSQHRNREVALKKLNKALAEQPAQQQETVANDEFCEGWKAARQFYTTPQAQSARETLTDEQIMEMFNKVGGATWISDFARAIEAAHGIKENT